jgi:beta-N-acetylhexosaminidase
MRLFYALLFFLFLFTGCTGRNGMTDNAEDGPLAEAEIDQAANATALAEIRAREFAARIALALDDRQLASQVIISGIDGKTRLSHAMRVLLAEAPAGGIMLFRYNLDTDNDTIKGLVDEASNLIMEKNAVNISINEEIEEVVFIPPFVSVDHEGGRVNRFRAGIADMPPASFYREIAENENHENAALQILFDSYSTGKAIKRLGINLNFAPVAEYLNDDNKIFLAERSYGEDPVFVTLAAKTFIEGMEMAGVLSVVKHFPGSVGLDPHYYSGAIMGSKDDLAELASPFAALINDGRAQAIMVSHSAVPAWDEENISSLSPAVMNGWLRGELGFGGIIICDDFSMGAVVTKGNNRLRPEDAAVQSLIAGADMVLVWPPQLRRTHRAILSALEDGSLSRKRLQDAAERIIFEKIRMGLITGPEEKDHDEN